MLPRDLRAEHFRSYAPEARRVAIEYLPLLRQLPLSFLPNLLRELTEFDLKFQIERRMLEKELANLASLSAKQLQECFHAFAQIQLSSQLERSDWAGAPARFVEQLSAYLWSTQQLDAFRSASMVYADRLQKAVPAESPEIPRLGITIIGHGVVSYDAPLFRKLRPHGAYFSRINPENGLTQLLEIAAARAKNHPFPYGHWYIDGGDSVNDKLNLTCISYNSLTNVRTNLLRKMQTEIVQPGMGPETMRTSLAQMLPRDLGLDGKDTVLDNFKLKLLTEGSGTQIFSTTFVQWSTREVLRRAQPLTIISRFAPRQRQRPMNELLSGGENAAEVDLVGSLLDADMGAYYNWLNQQRLAGAEQGSFIAWFEGHGDAVVVGPAVPRGTESSKNIDFNELLRWIS